MAAQLPCRHARTPPSLATHAFSLALTRSPFDQAHSAVRGWTKSVQVVKGWWTIFLFHVGYQACVGFLGEVLFFNLRSKKKKLGWLSQDEAIAIADDLGVETKTVFEMEGRLNAHDAAFDAGADEDDDTAYKAPAYYLEDHSADPALQVESTDYTEDANGRLHEALGDLDERSRTILQQRWLTEEKSTLHELADMYQVSAERIRQLEKNAMKKLKTAMGTDMILA